MAGVATNAADDAGGEILLLGTVILAMADLTTVLTGLVLVVTERSVEGGELTKLVALEFVLALRNRGSLQTCQHVHEKQVGLMGQGLPSR